MDKKSFITHNCQCGVVASVLVYYAEGPGFNPPWKFFVFASIDKIFFLHFPSIFRDKQRFSVQIR